MVKFFAFAAVLLLAAMLGPVAVLLASVPPGAALAAYSAPAAYDALRVSLLASSLAVAVATVLGVPAGYALAHTGEKRRGLALLGLALPLAFPPVASGIILLETIGTRVPLGAFLSAHGVPFVDSFWGVATAEFFVSGSFVAITACAAFGALDPIYEASAATLGASPWSSFVRVALPLAAPNLLAGILLAWLRAIGEYGATSVIAYHPTALPIALYVSLSARGVGAALSLCYGFVLLAIVVVGIQWALRRRVV